MKIIQKLLIANRGEIALRIIRSCQMMDIQTVAIHSLEDKDALFTKYADTAVLLEGETLQETYLNIPKIIEIAKANGVDAIHPGYGFMSENATFVQACDEAGIIFVGPSTESIELMGDKVASRKFAKQHGVPLLEGIEGSYEELLAKKDELHYPVIIKASAGGGGKGMRVVFDENEIESALEATAREALSYFGNDEVFIERYIQNPRHIEVQILGDQHGNVLHLFERECTIQRRHQKIIEEASSITLSDEQRKAITQSAVDLAKAANYYSAGTVEFIVDEDLNFFFMEMNTRIQVEHPVTENITGVDLIAEQIKIAQGQAIEFQQDEIKIDGHSIECRIYAEDPENDFRPSPGEITYYNAPQGLQYTRIDAALDQPQMVSGSYDPMIAKLITWGEDRPQALDNMQNALEQYVIDGIPTNIEYLKTVLADERFQNNEITTNYCKQFTEELIENREQERQQVNPHLPLLGALLFSMQNKEKTAQKTVWNQIGFYRMVPTIPMQLDGEEYSIEIQPTEKGYSCKIGEQTYSISNIDTEEKEIWFNLGNEEIYLQLHQVKGNEYIVVDQGFPYRVTRKDRLDENKDYETAALEEASGDAVASPIPGTVVKVIAEVGQEVKKGEGLIIVEAMKMENTLAAPRDGKVEKINFSAGDKVEAGKLLIELEV